MVIHHKLLKYMCVTHDSVYIRSNVCLFIELKLDCIACRVAREISTLLGRRIKQLLTLLT